MRPLRCTSAALALAATALLAPAPARAQALEPGDKLTYETLLAFGFDGLERPVRDPCTIETRIQIGVGHVDPGGMDVDLEIGLGVRAARYTGPSFSWAIEPVEGDGFVPRRLPAREADEVVRTAALPSWMPPLAQELVRKELAVLTTIASLHGRHASARVAVGPEPFVRVDYLDVPAFSREQQVIAERYLKAALLVAFPPVPLDLHRDAAGYEAGGARYAVEGLRDAHWPIRGRAHRVRTGDASSAARAALAFEALVDTGLEPAHRAPKAREWAHVHAPLGIAARRSVRVASALLPRDADPAKASRLGVTAVASWNAELVGYAGAATEVARR